MTPEYVTGSAVGLLSDFLVLYSIHNGGQVDVGALFDQLYLMNQRAPEEWDRARDKVIPMVHDLFVAYLHDSKIDLPGMIDSHTSRINGIVS
ncbi:hypothetical protein LOS78_05605 [Paracoccus sp. MA]|uniref:hypothetical protein n=1 Tax=Paracoccus sp. MA TaxID=2895796 RepID=UPI001E4521EB|nr:hypothetical protein [Paracoccus sp. MA]UFM63640.1 hypothetical protein LOS78_05605 [Paracoccus sp. MA]